MRKTSLVVFAVKYYYFVGFVREFFDVRKPKVRDELLIGKTEIEKHLSKATKGGSLIITVCLSNKKFFSSIIRDFNSDHLLIDDLWPENGALTSSEKIRVLYDFESRQHSFETYYVGKQHSFETRQTDKWLGHAKIHKLFMPAKIRKIERRKSLRVYPFKSDFVQINTDDQNGNLKVYNLRDISVDSISFYTAKLFVIGDIEKFSLVLNSFKKIICLEGTVVSFKENNKQHINNSKNSKHICCIKFAGLGAIDKAVVQAYIVRAKRKNGIC